MPPSCAAQRVACVRQQRDRVLEVADDRERQRGQPHRQPVERQSSARAGMPNSARDCTSGDGSIAGHRAPPLLGEQHRGAIQHRAGRARQHDEPEQHGEHLPIGVDEPALDREPRDVGAAKVRVVEPPRHAASARRAAAMSFACNAATIAEIAWLNRRNPMRQYSTTTFTSEAEQRMHGIGQPEDSRRDSRRGGATRSDGGDERRAAACRR